MSNESFRAQGATQLILTSSSTGQVAQQIGAGNTVAALLSNPSTSPVYLAFGSSAIAAAVPTTAVPAPGMCLPAGRERVFNTGPQGNWCSAVTSAGSAPVFATPGSGQ